MRVLKRTGIVIYNHPIGKDCFRMGLKLTPPLKKVIPAQFLHLRFSETYKHLLRRPFSIYKVFEKEPKIEILYQVVGEGTQLMSHFQPGEKIDILGPLGRGFKINREAKVSLLVAGGIGVAGLHLLLQNLIKLGLGKNGRQIYTLVGAQTKKKLYLIDSFQTHEIKLMIATEDGSAGQKGLVTDVLKSLLNTLKSQTKNYEREIQIYACGPEGMIETVSLIAANQKIPCQVSLERRMGCGVGICRACVCKVMDGESFRYATVCSEGPVFQATSIRGVYQIC